MSVLTEFKCVTLSDRSISSCRTPSESGENSKMPSSPIPRLESWKRDCQTHEQVVMGQSTKRSVAKMKTFLDEIEMKIEGRQKINNQAPEENRSRVRTGLVLDGQHRK